MKTKIAYLDFWQEFKGMPFAFEEINDINIWKNLKTSREYVYPDKGIGLFHFKNLEKILKRKLILVAPDDAEIIICSGFNNLRYLFPNKQKIFLCFESKFKMPDEKTPNTLYFSSILNTNPNFFYMPLYTCYYGYDLYQKFKENRNGISKEEFNIKRNCLSIISNGAGTFRNNFIDKLMTKIELDNYGKYKHNKDDQIIQNSGWYDLRLCDKINNYKFMICMENTSQIGYHTEKIMHGFRNNIIPIYWGDPVCQVIFNSDAYINVNQLGVDKAIEKIINLINNYEDYNKMLKEPVFKNDSVLFRKEFTKFLSEEHFNETIKKIFE
jgi:hypothetical protein